MTDLYVAVGTEMKFAQDGSFGTPATIGLPFAAGKTYNLMFNDTVVGTKVGYGDIRDEEKWITVTVPTLDKLEKDANGNYDVKFSTTGGDTYTVYIDDVKVAEGITEKDEHYQFNKIALADLPENVGRGTKLIWLKGEDTAYASDAPVVTVRADGISMDKIKAGAKSGNIYLYTYSEVTFANDLACSATVNVNGEELLGKTYTVTDGSEVTWYVPNTAALTMTNNTAKQYISATRAGEKTELLGTITAGDTTGVTVTYDMAEHPSDVTFDKVQTAFKGFAYLGHVTSYNWPANIDIHGRVTDQGWIGLAVWDFDAGVPAKEPTKSIINVDDARLVSITDLTTGTTVTNSEKNFEVDHKYEFVIEGIRAADGWTLKDLGTNVEPISAVNEWVAMDGARTEETADGVYTFTFNLEILKLSPGSSSPTP